MSDNAHPAHEVPEHSTWSQAGRGFFAAAWRHKALVALGVATGLLGAGFFYAQATPVYQSKAQVLVVKKRPDDVTGIDTRNLAIEDYVAAHTRPCLKAPWLLSGPSASASCKPWSACRATAQT
jgi:hypothetical protein